jgi:ferredoxin
MLLQEDRVVLHIPANRVTDPLIYKLVKDFDIAVNILKAEVTENDEGLMVVGLQGNASSLKKARKYLTDQGVRVQALKRDVHVIEERCTDCGVCTGQCPTAALYLDEDFKLQFDPEKCIACGHCAVACVFHAIEVMFDD